MRLPGRTSTCRSSHMLIAARGHEVGTSDHRRIQKPGIKNQKPETRNQDVCARSCRTSSLSLSLSACSSTGRIQPRQRLSPRRGGLLSRTRAAHSISDDVLQEPRGARRALRPVRTVQAELLWARGVRAHCSRCDSDQLLQIPRRARRATLPRWPLGALPVGGGDAGQVGGPIEAQSDTVGHRHVPAALGRCRTGRA